MQLSIILGSGTSMQCKYRFSPMRRPVILFAGTSAIGDPGRGASGHCMLVIGIAAAAAFRK